MRCRSARSLAMRPFVSGVEVGVYSDRRGRSGATWRLVGARDWRAAPEALPSSPFCRRPSTLATAARTSSWLLPCAATSSLCASPRAASEAATSSSRDSSWWRVSSLADCTPARMAACAPRTLSWVLARWSCKEAASSPANAPPWEPTVGTSATCIESSLAASEACRSASWRASSPPTRSSTVFATSSDKPAESYGPSGPSQPESCREICKGRSGC
mmetsp:Transcript_19868/g.37903  ORF Transcript_19868/g.37903 Transcript_19868/m.37903 type:complete len:216 (-) Transcript_19868:2305-2952(-)